MSLLVPALLGAGALAYVSSVQTMRHDAEMLEAERVAKAEDTGLDEGVFTDPRKWWGVDRRSRFVSLEEMTDVNGARVFLVDYGDGSKTYQWLDPRVVL